MVFDTPEKRIRGLQFKRVIEPGTLFVFPDITRGTGFHSENVPEPFDLAFLGADGTVLLAATVAPPREVVWAPEGTVRAVESKAGWLRYWGFLPGRNMQF